MTTAAEQVGPALAEPAAAAAPVRRRWVRAGWPAYGLALGFCALYAAVALLRAWHNQTAGYDLGIFSQAVRGYAHFQPPVITLKGPGFNQLGDHFSPALALLAPLWWLWPSPNMLLVAQSALLAGSSIPVTRFAARRLGTGAGVAIGAAYGLSWGLQGAATFDFHEVALGAPLLALAMVALAERRWWPAVCWAAPLVLVKEDLGVTVAAVGGYLLLRRQWRPGLVAAATGVGAFGLTTLVIIPKLDNLTGTYRYWGVVSDGAANTAGPPGLGDVLSLLWRLPGLSFSDAGKPELVLWVFGVTCFLALRSPLALVAVPTLLWRLVSDNPLYWSTGQVHYNALLMPVVFVALVDALDRLRRPSPGAARRWLLRLAPVAVLAVALAGLPRFSFAEIARSDLHRQSVHTRAGKRIAAMIPDGARVSANNYLIPLLAGRCEVYLFPETHGRPVDYYLLDSHNLDTVPGGFALGSPAYHEVLARHLDVLASQDGITLLRGPGG
jgi:uncharacterized membrane protein